MLKLNLTLCHAYTFFSIILISLGALAMEPSAAYVLCKQAQNMRHTEMYKIEEVRFIYNKALDVCSSDYEKARCYQGLAKTYYDSDADKSLECFDTAIKLAPYLVDLYFDAGDYCAFILKNHQKAFFYFTEGKCRSHGKNKFKLIWFFRSFGKMYRDQNALKEAEKIYSEGLSFCKKNFPKKIYLFYRLLGVVKSIRRNDMAAHEMYSKALENNDFSDFNATLETYQHLAQSYAIICEEKQASITFNKCQEYILNTKQLPLNTTMLPIFYHAWAQFYVSLARNNDALAILELYISKYSKLYSYDLSDIYLLYGSLLERAERLHEAKDYLHKAFEHANKTKNQNLNSIKSLLQKIYVKLNIHDELSKTI